MRYRERALRRNSTRSFLDFNCRFLLHLSFEFRSRAQLKRLPPIRQSVRHPSLALPDCCTEIETQDFGITEADTLRQVFLSQPVKPLVPISNASPHIRFRSFGIECQGRCAVGYGEIGLIGPDVEPRTSQIIRVESGRGGEGAV